MNATIKAIVQQRSLDPERVEALISLFGGDEDHVQKILLSRAKSHDDGHLKVAYKAADDSADDELTLSAADLAAIGKLVAEAVRAAQSPVVEQKRADPRYPPTGLVDQTKKAYDAKKDPFAVAMGADQVKR